MQGFEIASSAFGLLEMKSNKSPRSLTAGAAAILATASPAAKASESATLARLWSAGALPIGDSPPPPRPARPQRPPLRPPREMPRRRNFGSPAGRAALLHALAHIELNAIDLAWDLLARFAAEDLPRRFYDDWVSVAAEEARHFTLLARRLEKFGRAYGDMPAHDGLWEAACATAGDLVARLAVVPLVLEARGLDVTPAMAARLDAAGDHDSASILRRILADEIGHVRVGRRWFEWLCRREGLEPTAVFRDRVRRCFKGELKPPFNRAAREAAGLPAAYYEPLASDGSDSG
ncbi:MAG TPA: ferritin-like domain-containing protein [Stellaceae bacterium]|nr:ferritin-like domain-containing protein [Stellaceae bacterium]